MNRIQSIDLFRGFTIFMMVFVNDLAGVANIPDWMKHKPADANAMTFVDVVFPAFLFIVGMSIPLAIRAREARGDSFWGVLQHIAIRTAGLLLLGVFLVNSEEMNAAATLLPARLWNILLFFAALLIWAQYPAAEGRKNYLWRAIRVAGVALLFLLWWTYRKGEPGAFTGMTTSWWGILGLIGWAYLLATMVYLLLRENAIGLLGTMAGFVAIAILLKTEGLELPGLLAWLKGTSGHFIHASIALAGMSLACLFADKNLAQTPAYRIGWMVVTGLLLFVAGFWLRPFYGISKIYATPTWALYSAAICCEMFALIYWLIDVKNIRNRAQLLEPAGKNPLLVYLLPFFFYPLMGEAWLPEAFYSGALGFAKAVAFAVVILWIGSWLTKRGLRLQL
ncbi:MAG: DUF5009 domain-containing protein [Saprospiraceae bacterium]|nr:DUF5009 domain-containing protein [Saprospiraceae bacterium]